MKRMSGFGLHGMWNIWAIQNPKKTNRLMILLVLGLLVGAGILIPNEVRSDSTVQGTPTTTGTSFNEWTTPTNAYISDNNYATASFFVAGTMAQDYGSFGLNDMGMEITKVEVGFEYNISAPQCLLKASVKTTNGSYFPSGSATWNFFPYKAKDDDTISWIDFTSIKTNWTWDDLKNNIFYVKATAYLPLLHDHMYGCVFFIDSITIRVTYSDTMYIEMTSPSNMRSVHNTIDLVSKVVSSYTVSEVTYYISSRYYKATYDSGSGTYIYPEFKTKNFANGYLTVLAQANFTNGNQATHQIMIKIDNQVGKGCYFDTDLDIWICPQVRMTVPDRSEPRGLYEFTKSSEDTYWEMFYWYYESSTNSVSHALYSPIDSTYTDSYVIHDYILIDDYNTSLTRINVNATANTTTTTDDTEIENDTYVNHVDLGGANVTVNCTVGTTDVVRISHIFIAQSFDWSYNPATMEYTYSWDFTNNLPGMMDITSVSIPFEVPAAPESIEVWDSINNIQLDAGKDYIQSLTDVSFGVIGLSAGSKKSLTVSYSPYVTGTDILKPTISILKTDVDEQPVVRNSHSYNRAVKEVYNSNNFDYSGVMIVHWQAGSINWNSLVVEDSEGSVYEWYTELGQLIVKDVSLDRHESKTFYFYFDPAPESGSMMGLLYSILPFILIALLMISIVCGVTLAKTDLKDERRKFLLTLGYGSFFIFMVLLVVIFVLPIFLS